MKTLPSILIIAATDPSGGAGVEADIRTAMLCGVHACVALTGVTIQNTQVFSASCGLERGLLRRQIECVANDVELVAVKVGMLPTAHAVEETASALKEFELRNIVIDPIAAATLAKGAQTLGKASETFAAASELLYPLADILTPNLPEGARLLGDCLPDELPQAAAAIAERVGCKGVLLKGGHGEGEYLHDFYYNRMDGRGSWFVNPRCDTRNTHGTGCVLSTAIASGLAKGENDIAAIAHAEALLRKMLNDSKNYSYGKGNYASASLICNPNFDGIENESIRK